MCEDKIKGKQGIKNFCLLCSFSTELLKEAVHHFNEEINQNRKPEAKGTHNREKSDSLMMMAKGDPKMAAGKVGSR